VGTAASLAANVAVGGHDVAGRALAGWPAVSLLVSVKLQNYCRGKQSVSARPSA
jgi:hypothetical protein